MTKRWTKFGFLEFLLSRFLWSDWWKQFKFYYRLIEQTNFIYDPNAIKCYELWLKNADQRKNVQKLTLNCKLLSEDVIKLFKIIHRQLKRNKTTKKSVSHPTQIQFFGILYNRRSILSCIIISPFTIWLFWMHWRLFTQHWLKLETHSQTRAKISTFE